jgi:hypothetical protein
MFKKFLIFFKIIPVYYFFNRLLCKKFQKKNKISLKFKLFIFIQIIKYLILKFLKFKFN